MGVKGRRGRSILVAAALSLFVLFGFVLTRELPLTGPLLASAPRARPPLDEPLLPSYLPLVAPVPTREEAPFLELVTSPLFAGPEVAGSEEFLSDCDELVRALAHDDIRGNAYNALSQIAGWRRRPDGQRMDRSACLTSLSDALNSPDHQQRQLAAYLFATSKDGPYPEALSTVLVEALRYDHLYYDPATRARLLINNEACAVRFFASHPEEVSRARNELELVLFSDDGQQRFLAAFVLGWAHCAESASTICPLLIAQLSDNNIKGDAMMACGALYHLGVSALPYIRSARAFSTDLQATALLDLIGADILDPPTSLKERVKRGEHLRASMRGQRVSPRHHDPVVEFGLGDPIACWGEELSGDRFYTPR